MKNCLYTILALLLLQSCAMPMAEFLVGNNDGIAPVQVQFENQSKESETYQWDFGDGNTSTEADPVHRYNSSGNYEVTLTASKGNKKSIKTKRIVINAPEICRIEIETSLGTMTAELYNDTPLHRDNFVKLAENEYYNDLIFHRVIEGFMIQGGDPNSRNAKEGVRLGSGGPGYQIPSEINDTLVHVKGALAAARTGDNVNPERKSSGSQFYIVHGQPLTEEQMAQVERMTGIKYSAAALEAYTSAGGTPQLDGQYTVFGRIIDGLEVIDKIAAAKTLPGDRPQENITMKIRLIK